MSLKTILAAAAFALAVQPALAETIKIGVTPGPHAEILEQVKPIAHAKGLDIEIVEFSDYVVPNAALDTGELDANSFQHEPYLVNEIDKRGYKISKVANTVTFPIGIYSKKIKAIGELRDGVTVGIPNDPTNGGRVLLLLQSAGLI
ncbi:MAG TPA: MetQ/NlpA family ABC transporter substrate-binding protein, partial [Inquilinus sp.]